MMFLTLTSNDVVVAVDLQVTFQETLAAERGL